MPSPIKPIVVDTIVKASFRRLGPDYTLVSFRDWAKTFVKKLLNSLAAIRPSSIQVALGIRGSTMYGVKFAWLPSPVTEGGEDDIRFGFLTRPGRDVQLRGNPNQTVRAASAKRILRN